MAEQDLPVIVVGAGPVGLAAATHLRARGLRPLVLEAGDTVGAAMSEWGHIRTFTPWKYIVDPTAADLLASAGWSHPTGNLPPTGAEIVDRYLRPLAATLGPDVVRTGARVLAVTRQGLDKSRTIGREGRPFVVRVATPAGVEDLTARAVIDASGTWGRRNPLGASGLLARGEEEARDLMVGPLPDVLGRDRARFAGRRTLVVGLGHSAANTLLALAALAEQEPGTGIVWAILAATPDRIFGGGDADALAARGKLGTDLRSLVATGRIELVPGFAIESVAVSDEAAVVTGTTDTGPRTLEGIHNIAAATGFRPDLSILSELRLDLDPGLEAPAQLAPLIDPQFHSCGTVPPHGHRDLAQPEPGFYIVGMKSYGRAPTFLITTGNEQVRSIAAALAGDYEAADAVKLVLPETGVCSTDLGGGAGEAACCGTATLEAVAAHDEHHRLLPVGVAAQGFVTDLSGGNGADHDLGTSVGAASATGDTASREDEAAESGPGHRETVPAGAGPCCS